MFTCARGGTETSLELVSSCGCFVAHLPLSIACRSPTIARTILAGAFRERLESRVTLSTVAAAPMRILVAYLVHAAGAHGHSGDAPLAGDEHALAAWLFGGGERRSLVTVPPPSILLETLLAAHYLELPTLMRAAASATSSFFASASADLCRALPDEIVLLVLHFCAPFEWLLAEVCLHQSGRCVLQFSF